MSNFDSAFIYLINNEGQKAVNNPADKGGLTRYGVTQKSWDAYRSTHTDAAQLPPSVADATMQMARDFYGTTYWLPLGCGQLNNDAMATVIFDASVLMGISSGVRFAQAAINSVVPTLVAVDGVSGKQTVKALNSTPVVPFMFAFSASCQQRFCGIVGRDATQRIFLRTWLRRAVSYLELLP